MWNNRFRKLLVVCVAVGMAVACASAGTAIAAAGGPPVSHQELQGLLDRAVTAGTVGVAALVDDGRGTWVGTSGLADVETGTKVGGKDRFRVGSVTKTFVATVVLQLVAEGKLDLDAPVSTRLPGVVAGGDAITIRQLLNHTSGLYNYTDDESFIRAVLQGQFFTPRELVDVANSHGPLSPPGVTYAYANTNYLVAGLVVEAVAGTTLEHEVQQRLIEPLKLRATSFPTFGGAMDRPYARGYVAAEGELFDATTPYPHWPSWLWASGNMVSDASDLATFYQALLGGELLPEDLLTAMKTPAAGSDYGLGLYAERTSCGTVWGHQGGIPGYRSVAGASEDGTRAVVMLINVTPPPDVAADALTEALNAAVCAALGRGPVPPAQLTGARFGHSPQTVLVGRP